MNKLPEHLFDPIPPSEEKTLRALKYPNGKVPYLELKEIIEKQDKELKASLRCASWVYLYETNKDEEWNEQTGGDKDPFYINQTMLRNFAEEYGWEYEELLSIFSEEN